MGVGHVGIGHARITTASSGTSLAPAALDPTGTILTGARVSPNTIVTVYVTGAAVGTATSNSSGAWTYTFGTAPVAGALITYAAVTAAATTATGAGSSSAPGGGPNNTADFSDPNNAYLVAVMAA